MPQRSRLIRSVLVLASIGLAGQSSLIAPAGVSSLPSPGGWSSTGPMLAGRAEHTATRLLDGRVLVTGGTDDRRRALASTELFNPRSGRWASGPAMRSTRVDQTATLLADGRVLVTGGFNRLDQSERSLSSAEIFDERTNRWAPAAPMSVARARHTATLLTTGKVLVVGGYSSPTAGTLGGFATLAEVYDPQANRWAVTEPMGTGGRQGHTATRLDDGRVLVAGGEGTLGSNPSVEIYDPSTNGWTFAHFLLAPHVGHTATLLASGDLLIAGGAGSISPTLNEPAALATLELYDPFANQWSVLAPMHSTRDRHTATLLGSGRLLVVGGAFTSTPLAELYEPASDAWRTIPGTAMNRYAHTATLLEDGRVLVAGGYTTQSMASAWIYDVAGRPAHGDAPALLLPLAFVGAGIAVVVTLLGLRRRPPLRIPRWPSPRTSDEWIDP